MSLEMLRATVAPSAMTGSTPPASPVSNQMIGWKLPPVCQEEKLKEMAMSAEELSKLTFDLIDSSQVRGTSATDAVEHCLSALNSTVRKSDDQRCHEAIPASSSSSTCTRESDVSDAEGSGAVKTSVTVATATPPSTVEQVRLDREKSDQINAKVSLSKTSRQGRGSQRWLMASTGPVAATGASSEAEDCAVGNIRLVTGCVPILKGGKILLVSASRKPEWILPKGGWEIDEAIEESAIREVFEEAGVLGVLGPKLTEIQYETRKSKKRRLEQAQILEKKLKKADEESSTDSESYPNVEQSGEPAIDSTTSNWSSPNMGAPISHEDMSRIRSLSQDICRTKNNDESASSTSAHSSAYSQVRMTLFPLYVNKILSSWPEQGRFRTAVDIDKAIEMQDSRPEFKAALLEVKARGLHLLAS